jgi:hypothetical protein
LQSEFRRQADKPNRAELEQAGFPGLAFGPTVKSQIIKLPWRGIELMDGGMGAGGYHMRGDPWEEQRFLSQLVFYHRYKQLSPKREMT